MSKVTLGTIIIASSLTFPLAHAFSSTEHSEQKSKTEKIFKQQLQQNMSVGRAIKSITNHYPKDIENIVSIALELHPEKYKEIIHSAISAEPSLTEQIVTVAINKGVTSCANIVETAIQAEPSYVDFVVNVAANTTPDQLDEIVRIAVLTEPDSADNIVQTLAKSHPNKVVDIMTTAIGTVPFVGEYIVDALLAVFPNEAEGVVTEAVRHSSDNREHVKRVLLSAHNAGLSNAEVQDFGLKGGATADEIALVLAKKK